MKTLDEIYLDLSSLSVYKYIINENVITSYYRLLGLLTADKKADLSDIFDLYTNIYYNLKKDNPAKTLFNYLYDLIVYEPSSIAKAVEEDYYDEMLYKSAKNDLKVLSELAALPCRAIKDEINKKYETKAADMLPEWEGAEKTFDFDNILEFYRLNGYGIFAKSRAFVWENKALRPIKNPDNINVKDMVLYYRQRQLLINNTKALLSGKRVNNVLLYGDSGTGKSATVKSMINIEEFSSLRIIEIPKEQLSDIPDILRLISGHKQKFILFIDDLSFENNEEVFSSLKVILEGGLETRPQNVVIYATSNRRHLVKEYFKERSGLYSSSQDEEIHANETIQEKISLSDRFGLKISYTNLSKKEFLYLVCELAKQKGLNIDKSELEKKAIEWDAEHPGRTPRIAHQFIDFLCISQ